MLRKSPSARRDLFSSSRAENGSRAAGKRLRQNKTANMNGATARTDRAITEVNTKYMAATVEVARAHPNPNIAPVMLIAHAGELRKYGSSTYKSAAANPPPAKPSTDKPPIRYATGNGGGTSASARRAAQPSRQLAI